MQGKRTSAGPHRSCRLTTSASVWSGDVRRSRRIAATRRPVQDNLPATHDIIPVCRRVLGDNFRVHVPRQGALGPTSFVQLRTVAELPHMVYGFSLGRISEFWLLLEEEAVAILFRTHQNLVTAKPQKRYVTETFIANLTTRLIVQKMERVTRALGVSRVEEEDVLTPNGIVATNNTRVGEAGAAVTGNDDDDSWVMAVQNAQMTGNTTAPAPTI
jgi:hypothetical protein